jgi:2,4-dienoyl-CoA reductase-like NADH-dependent reductase (Old Yellow Enzyme family)
MLPQHEILFEPLELGKLKLKNRVALAPTHVGMAAERGIVTDQILCYYYARAAGGLGLVIVEITGVTGRYAFAPGLGLGAASDHSIPGLRDLAQVIHWGGARALIQLIPGQGAQALHPHPRRDLVGPSDVPALLQKEELPKAMAGLAREDAERPRPLTLEEISQLKTFVAAAAMRAKVAGFDGVELHGAHGYLLCQFTSPYFNQRKDHYGGTPENRWRLSLEMIREVKAAVGADFVVGYRFSAREGIPGGLDLAESTEMARAIQEAGADYLSVSQGCYGAVTQMFPKEDGYMTDDAKRVREAVSIPVMCPNFRNPDQAAKAVSDGAVDCLALSRALVADPLWTRKVEEGRPEEINHCIRCYGCARAVIIDHHPVRCPVNPMLGFERFDPASLPGPPSRQEA